MTTDIAGGNPLALERLLIDAISENHLWDSDERPAIVRQMTSSVTQRLLDTLSESDSTRAMGERLQDAHISGDDVLVAAIDLGLIHEEGFAKAFSSVLAEVIDEVVEVVEADDAVELRARLHESVISRMTEEQEGS